MPKQYIAKALSVLSADGDGGLNLCDMISEKLTAMSEGDVRNADSACSFYFIGLRAPPHNTERTVSQRRAAVLLKRLFPETARSIRPDHSESWNENLLYTYVSSFKTMRLPTGRRFYLRGSFWAYAGHAEREHVRAAWPEALRLLAAGIRVAESATPDARRLRVKWFGPMAAEALPRQLRRLNDQIAANKAAICYQGSLRGTFGGTIHERGQNGAGGAGGVQLNKQVGGSSKFETGALSLGAKFFEPSSTVISRSVAHDVNVSNSPFTRGGVVLHELTHLYLNTVDVGLNSAGIRAVNFPAELSPTVAKFEKYRLDRARALKAGKPPGPPQSELSFYGPMACHTLAQQASEFALKNADNYRLFCEDALLSR